jgi:hypothetical protein
VEDARRKGLARHGPETDPDRSPSPIGIEIAPLRGELVEAISPLRMRSEGVEEVIDSHGPGLKSATIWLVKGK